MYVLFIPYSVKTFYEDTDEYIIYNVEAVHHASAKRYSAKVILKHPSNHYQISKYEKEIINKIKNLEIHNSQISENAMTGKPANIIWCYFGYDEDDMVDSNYICHTTWVDDTQDKEWWYKQTKNTCIVNDTFIKTNPSYNLIKSMKNKDLDVNEFINKSKELTNRIICNSLKFISFFREYENQTISESQLVKLVKPIIESINKDYFELSNMDIAPNELHDWCQCQMKIANDACDFTLYFNEKTMSEWNPKNRVWLMNNTISRFETDLEKYTELNKSI